MREPRRLNEESELFAKLVADMRRDCPSPEPLERLLETINAMPDIEPEPAKLGGKKLFLLASAGLLSAVGAATLMARSLPAGSPSTPGVTVDTSGPEVVVVAPSPAQEVPSATVADLPDVPSPAGSFGSRAAPARAVPTAAAASPPSTGHEFEIIVAARRALTGGGLQINACRSLRCTKERFRQGSSRWKPRSCASRRPPPAASADARRRSRVSSSRASPRIPMRRACALY